MIPSRYVAMNLPRSRLRSRRRFSAHAGAAELVDTELGVDSGPMIPALDSMYAPIRAVAASENLKLPDINS